MKSQLQNITSGNINTTNINTIANSLIPIYISLQYEKNFLKFPINPESLEVKNPSSSKSVNINGLGEVAIPQRLGLKTLTIKSFFWGSNPNSLTLPSEQYVQWLEKWQRSRKPAKLIVTRLGYSMQVICDSFTHSINAGEEENVYFTLELREYRSYGAKRLGVVSTQSILQKIQNLTGDLVSPILVDIPLPARDQSSKPSYSSPYTTKKGDTVCSVTKKITGTTDDWESLYDLNSTVLGNITEGTEIPAGTKLQLPLTWTGDNNTNIKVVG